jgi:hypothetical protein
VKKIISVNLIYFISGCTIALADTAADGEKLAATINYLLVFVEKSDCTFFRNDSPHTAKEAAVHMQRKYDHFKEKIKTPEDFIRLSATKSLISGKPYMVKTKAGQHLKSEIWLLEALESYRQNQHGQTTDTQRQSIEQ